MHNEEEQDNEIIPEQLQEILNNLNLPPDEQKKITKYVTMSSISMGRFSSPANPIAEKIDESHIHKLIESDKEESERAFLNIQTIKKLGLTVFIILMIFIVFLAFYFNEDKTQFTNILFPILTLAVGAIGGLGYGQKIGYEKAKKEYD